MTNIERQIITIQKVSNAVASNLGIEKMLQSVLDSITEGLNYKASAVLIVDENREYLKGTTTSGNSLTLSLVEKLIGSQISNLRYSLINPELKNLAVKAFLKKEVFTSSNLFDFAYPIMQTPRIPKMVQRVYGMDYIAAVPMKSRSDVEGILLVGREKDDLSVTEKELLQLFANQAGIAIKNAKLYKKVTNFNTELQQKVEEATQEIKTQYQDLLVLRKITDLITSTLDVNKVCQEIVDSVTTRLNFVAGLISLVDKEREEICPAAISNTSIIKRSRPFLGDVSQYCFPLKDRASVMSRVVQDKKISLTDDLASVVSPPVNLRIAQRLQKMNKIEGCVVLPIIAQGETIGVLLIALNKSAKKITTQERQTLETLANQAGLAINNALLFEKTQSFNVELKEEVNKATKDLREANAKLTKLDKAKSEFISIASHQLRTPLSTIKGYIAMILDGDYGMISDEVAKSLTRVYNSNERLVTLVNNMLNVSRIEGGRIEFNPKPLQIGLVIQDAINELAQVISKNSVQVEFNANIDKLQPVLADEKWVHEVILNLIDNAVKYSPGGKVKISAKSKRGVMEVTIKDNGIGFSAHDKEQLFKKFSRGHKASKTHTGGSGLGLYVVKKLVNMHGGEIEADSKGEGRGSSFQFTIPLA